MKNKFSRHEFLSLPASPPISQAKPTKISTIRKSLQSKDMVILMYVHAGNNRIIRMRDIVGIFDMDTATMEGATREYLRFAEKDGRMINIKEEIPKSFIVTKAKGEKDSVYVSQISTSALLGRVKAGIKE